MAACGLRPQAPARPGENNRPQRAKAHPEGAGRSVGEVYRDPHEPAQARSIPQEERPTESGWPWVIGGGTGNRIATDSPNAWVMGVLEETE